MDPQDIERVAPVMPAAAWVGGKRLLADRIGERLAEVPHRAWVEPFIGMGGVFFRKGWRSRVEVINDANGEIVNLFRILQHHLVPFTEMLRWQLASRAEFARLQSVPPEALTDLQRAARFLYLQRLAFGGKVTGQTFGVSANDPSGFDVADVIPRMAAIHDRLSRVVIEHLGYRECIARYDRPETLFYLDPPYWDCESIYGRGLFTRADFTAIAGQLRGIKGKFMLSLNDVPEVRALFEGFRFEAVKTVYTVSEKGPQEAGELLITNMEAAPARLI